MERKLASAVAGDTSAAIRPIVGGFYGPNSEAWRLNREATLLLAAGPRALLLQLAHPLVAEGVDQHSAFREDPWGRLEGTLESYLRIVYGSAPAAAAEIERLNGLHAQVSGPVRTPEAREIAAAESYAARDPQLSLWVHATLIDSTLVANDAWLGPLSPARQARFYAETLPVGRAFGIPDRLLPQDLGAFRAYMDAMLAPDGPIQVTPTARELAATILHPPLGPIVKGEGAAAAAVRACLASIPPGLYDWLMWPALELLPPRVRDAYGIAWTPARAVVSRWLVAGYGFWRPRLPAALRWMPQARAADRRIRTSRAPPRSVLGAGHDPRAAAGAA